MTDNPYLDQLRQDDERAMRLSMMGAVDKNPDDEAKLRDLAARYQLPLDAVRLDRKTVERRAALDSVDYATLAKENPIVAALFNNPNDAAIVYDDVENLGAMEKTLNASKNVGKSLLGGVAGFGEGMAGMLEAGADTLAGVTGPIADFLGTPDVLGRPLARDMRALRQNQTALREQFTPKAAGNIEAGVYSGLQSLTQNLLTVPFAAMSGNPAIMLNTLAATTGGQSYGRARDKGLTPAQAALFGAGDAAIEYGTELAPVVKLFGDLKAGAPLIKTLANQLLTEVPGEQLATALQDLNEFAMLNPQANFNDYLAARPDAAIQTLVATVVGSGGMVSLIKGADTLINRQAQRAQQAEARTGLFDELNTLAASSKVLQRDPDLIKTLADNALADSDAQAVYIDAKTLMQSGVAEQVMAAIPDVARQLPDALETGGEVKIATSDYLSRVAGSEYAQSLVDHLRLEGDDFTRAQAREYQKNHADELQAEVERAMIDNQRQQAAQSSMQAVKTIIKDQLDSAGRFTGTVNDHNATVVASFYAAMGARMGMSAESLWERLPMNVQSRLGNGLFLNQGNESAPSISSGNDPVYNQPRRPKRDDYTLDLFDLPNPAGSIDRADVSAGAPLSRDDTPRGQYATRTRIVEDTTRQLGTTEINTPEQAAQALAYLSKSAVERFDALVTDVNGKPLAIVGAFKGTIDGASVYPLTVTNEAFRIQGAANIWFAHNHPSGTNELSQADRNINEKLTEAFRGSQITPRGLFAISGANGQGRNWVYTPAEAGSDDITGTTTPPSNTATVPVVERIFQEEGKLAAPVNNPDAARKSAAELSNGESGLLLMDNQNVPVAFVPANSAESETLRTDGRMDGLYRALSMSNAKAAIIVNQGDLTQNAVTNLAGFLNASELRVLDVLAKNGDAFESWADFGLSFGHKTFFQNAAMVPKKINYVFDPDWISENRDIYELQSTDTSTILFSGVSDDFVGEVIDRTGNTDDLFNGIFASERLSVAESHGGGKVAVFRINNDEMLSNREIFQIDDELKENALFKAIDEKFKKGTDEFYTIWEAVVEDKSDFGELGQEFEDGELIVRDGSFMDLYNYSPDDVGDAGWFAQKLRGKFAAALGYKAIAMNDEHGTSWLITPGVKAVRIRNIDQFSQSSTDNTVEFSPENPNILNQSNDANRGAFNPETRTITLLDNADLSTFLHESGHLFLELQLDLAANLSKESDMIGLTDMQRQVLADTQKLLDWFGVPDLESWFALDFEQKRGFHEQFAKGFEQYLFEGQAPSLELARVFASFRAWLKQVYQHIKTYFDDVKLTADVRQVFDRMLATDEQIELAQQGRSLMPLFSDQAKSGMDETQFAEYQAAWQNATSEAKEQLALKGVRDMQWLQNARNRKLKELQQTHDALRREIRAEVRMDVYARPVYQAWQFLTRKLTEDDKLTPLGAPKSDPAKVDARQDSLFVAIAKLGGIDRQEIIERWDWDHVGRAPTPVFGKPVVRKAGGLSIEAMAEKLVDEGYLDTDAHGKFDTRQFEERFDAELRGQAQYSNHFDSNVLIDDAPAGSQVINPLGLQAGRLEMVAVQSMDGMTDDMARTLEARKMTARNGLHPDLVAELFDFSSGDELIHELIAATPPKELIEQLTDQRMLQEHGELSSPEAISDEANRALFNDARARFVTTEANALAKAVGGLRLLGSAAKEMAYSMISRVKIRDLSPSLYSRAEAQAAKLAQKAEKAGDIETAAAEKRNQALNVEATKAAYQAKTDIDKGLKYLKKFDGGGLPQIAADYNDQILAILDRYDFRKLSDAERNRRQQSLSEWLTAQEDQGFTPNVPPELLREHQRIPYKDLTVEELRGLIDTVQQIEHMGRQQRKLFVLSQQRGYEQLVNEVEESILANVGNRRANDRTSDTMSGKAKEWIDGFYYSHLRAGSMARVFDGGEDGGRFWQYFIKPANERGDWETTQRAEATRKLSEIMKPIFAAGKLHAKRFYPDVGQSFTRSQVLAMALNFGNDSNIQRLLGGENWTFAKLESIVSTLSFEEWQAVQRVWDLFESYKPLVAEKERRLYGKEPNWITPRPVELLVKNALGEPVNLKLRGGYYPVKYDPRASQQAEQHADAEDAKNMLKAAYTAATTRRSFTKNRVDVVLGRPLLYSLDGVFMGLNEVIHDLAWHEWLIDMNKVMASTRIDQAIRRHYGPEMVRALKQWEKDIAGGDTPVYQGIDKAASFMRQNISAAGLGINFMSAAMQITGFTQTVARIGMDSTARGLWQFMSNPRAQMQFVNAQSAMMTNRARTRFRELNELRNRINADSEWQQHLDEAKFFMIVRAQQLVDYPTWLGQYDKMLRDGHDETTAAALADQAVIDAQGGGQIKDLSAAENSRNPWLRLFTLFYNFMGTNLNLLAAETMTQKQRGKLAANVMMLTLVPVILEHALRAALTPDGDDWDEVDFAEHARLMVGELVDRMMGLFIMGREFSGAVKAMLGVNEFAPDYTGPIGVRMIADAYKFGQQAAQGDFDTAFRKSAINLLGDFSGLPTAQINKTWSGAEALADDKTDNPAALLFGMKN